MFVCVSLDVYLLGCLLDIIRLRKLTLLSFLEPLASPLPSAIKRAAVPGQPSWVGLQAEDKDGSPHQTVRL